MNRDLMPNKWTKLRTKERIISHFIFELKIPYNDGCLNENQEQTENYKLSVSNQV